MTTAVLNFSRVSFSKIDLPKINWKMVCVIGFLMSLFLLIFYVWQINNLSRGAYLISSYEKQISKLSNENKNLEVSFARSSFLGQAFEKIHALNFQKTTSVKYIQIPDNSVATIKK